MVLDFRSLAVLAAIVVVISVGIRWYHHQQQSMGYDTLVEDEAEAKVVEKGLLRSKISKGLGRPVRAKVIYSSSQMEEDEEAVRRSIVKAEQEAKKKAEDADFEAFKKKKFTMKDIPDFSGISLDSGDSALSGFI